MLVGVGGVSDRPGTAGALLPGKSHQREKAIVYEGIRGGEVAEATGEPRHHMWKVCLALHRLVLSLVWAAVSPAVGEA